MPAVREGAARLLANGTVVVSQRGRRVDPLEAHGPIRVQSAEGIDYRRSPGLYRIGRGEEGVFHVQPYKAELLPLWRFRTPEEAQVSSEALWNQFLAYAKAGDFVGMDMARKYLQMGWTRSRRYANHRGGKKYAKDGSVLPVELDALKARSAEIFHARYQQALQHPVYRALRLRHEKGGD